MLELLLLGEDPPGPPVLIPQLESTARDPLAVALLETAPGRRRLLPGADPEAPAPAVRAWHRDAWLSLPTAERRSVAVVAGPGAASLAPLIDGARVAVTVRDPLETVSAIVRGGVPLPPRHTLAALREEPGRLLKQKMRIFSNPQARALLLAAADAGELPVTLGPPSNAHRWRDVLFNDALSRVELIGVDAVATAAGDLAAQLGYPPGARTRASSIAGRLSGRRQQVSIDEDRAELLRELNWLDVELFARCGVLRFESA